MPLLLVLCVLVIGPPAVGADLTFIDVAPLRSDDVRAELFRNAVRAFRLDDASTFVTVRSAGAESAITGAIIDRDGRIQLLEASRLLPTRFVMAGTRGQIFAAALLTDENNLAVSVGWTNPAGRNINGIVLLHRISGDWSPRNVIVVPGSVRDLAAGPDAGVLAVTTEPGPGSIPGGWRF